eukprot:gene31282-38951_t
MFEGEALTDDQVAAHAVCCDCIGVDKCALGPGAAPADAPPDADDGAASGVPSATCTVCHTAGGGAPWWAAMLLFLCPMSLLVLLQVMRKGVSWGDMVDFMASQDGAQRRHTGRQSKRTQRHQSLMAEIQAALVMERGQERTPEDEYS